MTNEILHTFNSKFSDGLILDASFGEGGHSFNLIKSSSNNHVIGLDCDHTIAKKLTSYLQHKYRENNRFHFIHSKWSNMYANITKKLPEISNSDTMPLFDGILLETGTSIIQEKIKHRGLSFDTKTANLDMRHYTTTSKHDSLAIRDVLNHPNLTVDLLSDILHVFCHQNLEISTKIAQSIINHKGEVCTMENMVDIIESALRECITDKEILMQYPDSHLIFHKRKHSQIRNDHPIKQILNGFVKFINNSYVELFYGLRQIELLLKPNGILMLICYDKYESQVIAKFLESRNLLNINPDNTQEKAVYIVDKNDKNVQQTTFQISEVTLFLKERNERLAENEWHGIGAARFNDFNAVPFIQPHTSEMSSHPKARYSRMIVLERTDVMSKEDDTDLFINNEDKMETKTLTHDNLSDVITARNDATRKLLQYPSHNSFMY